MGKRRELSEIIPPENLKFYMAVYSAMKDTYYAESKKWPGKEYEKVITELSKLRSKEFISRQSFETGAEMILRESLETDNFSAIGDFILRLKYNTQAGTQKDIPYDFILFAIISDLKHYTGKPNYVIATEFLQKEKIISTDLTPEAIRRRYGRLSFKVIFQHFIFCLISGGESMVASIKNNSQKVFLEGFVYFLMKAMRGFSSVR